MQHAQAPGSIRFEQVELDLVREARVITLTGWTHDEYEAAPLVVVDALLQYQEATDSIQTWRVDKARRKR